MSIFCKVDDKNVPMFRVLWIADVPHFCGHDQCTAEGRYEVRLEQDESLWATREERDEMMAEMERWHGAGPEEEDW